MAQQFNQIWHGDSIELCKKIKPGRVQSLITDPPFGSDNQSNSAVTPNGKEMARKIENDETPEQAMATFSAVWKSLAPAMKPDSDIYIFTAWQVLEEWLPFTRELLAADGYERKAIGLWTKTGPGQGDLKSWGIGHEFILYYKRGKRECTDTRRSLNLAIPQLRPDDLIHPHEKPVPLLQALLRHSTDRGDFVIDPFGGSGSLGRAARQIGRNSVTIELNEKNFDLSVKKMNATSDGMFDD